MFLQMMMALVGMVDLKMNKLEKVFKNIRKSTPIAGLGLTSLLFFSESCTPAQQKVVAGEVVMENAKTPEEYLAGRILKTVGDMEQEIDVAEAGKDEINISIGENAPYTETKSIPKNVGSEKTSMKNWKIVEIPYHPTRNKGENIYEVTGIIWKDPDAPRLPLFFTCNKHVDLDGDKKSTRGEFFGLGKKDFDLSKEPLRISYLNYSTWEIENALFRSWTEAGTLIGETSTTIPARNYKTFYTGLDMENSTPPDFLDKLRENGSGKYIITLDLPNVDSTYKLDLNIANSNE